MTLGASANWSMRLAAYLKGEGVFDAGVAGLHGISADYVSGDPAIDQTRGRILRLLADRQAQLGTPGLHPAVLVDPLPEWPGPTPTPVPPFHAAGLAGTSLVALCASDTDDLPEAWATWLATKVDEVVLVDMAWPSTLARTLATQGIADPRLRVVGFDVADVTATQAFNIGLRLARHQRILALSTGVELAPDYLAAAPLAPSSFQLHPGPVQGTGILLDVNRRDLALAGGFNEYLDTLDFAIDDLSARLQALGLRAAPIPAALFSAPPAPVLPPWDDVMLRTALRQRPSFPALTNRYIAALMPDWLADQSRTFLLAQAANHALVLSPSPAATLKTPVLVRADAENHALGDLIAAHIGGAPILLGLRRLDVVLARPAQDVCALDVAVAATLDPDLVKSRRAWLLVDVTAEALLHDEKAAHMALEWVQDRANAAQMSLILRLAPDVPSDAAALLSDLPTVTADPSLSRWFWSASLRDLAEGQPTGHATLAFDRGYIADFKRFKSSGPSILRRRPKLFIDAQHGLGNRLRAIASAGAIATASRRELVIIWAPDAHCACRFEDLFEPGGAVLDQGFHAEATAMGMDLFNYMEVEPASAKDQPIAVGALRDIYLRSAYPLVHPASTWEAENAILRQFRPNAVVQDLVRSVRQPNDISIHIRMEGGTAAEHLPYESPENWTAQAHRDIDHWRKRSHYSHFQKRLDLLIAEGQADRIFLATDTPAAQEALLARYGQRIACLPRHVTDRSTQAMVYALADAILLGSAPRILGSNWSSFTELAARLATAPIALELSGRDF